MLEAEKSIYVKLTGNWIVIIKYGKKKKNKCILIIKIY